MTNVDRMTPQELYEAIEEADKHVTRLRFRARSLARAGEHDAGQVADELAEASERLSDALTLAPIEWGS